jgi:type IV pilus assembly protein PilB
MSVPSYFSRVAKILIQSGYVNPKQMQQAIAKFQESGRAIAQGGLSLTEVLESITKQPLPEHLRHHLLRNFSSSSSSFTEKLIQSGYVNHDQMQQALAETRKSGTPLTEILEAMTGRQCPPDLLRQSKKQLLFELKIIYGIDSLDPEQINSITYNQIKALIDSLIPIDICRRYRLLPIRQTETQPPSILVAMVDPDNLDAQDDLTRLLRPQGLTLQRMVITQEDYQEIISKYLDEKLARQKQQELEKSVDIKQDLENIDTLSDAPDEVEEVDLKGAEDAPVINLVNTILAKALQEGASDIHVEPQENDLRIRFRKDGVLRQAFDPVPKKVVPAVLARLKIMAELDIAERRLPQFGKIRRMYQGRRVDFRVSTLPSRYGENVVLRVLDNSATQLGLPELITDQDTLQRVREMASRPFGLILVTGPIGSGKSTTLYSILAERNKPGVGIFTVEDPIEHSLPGITQVQALREKGMDFASILLSFLQQDPDVILVARRGTEERQKRHLKLPSKVIWY